MNWWAVIIITMWLSAAIGSISTKNAEPFWVVLLGNLIVGIGYLCIYL